MVGTIEPFSNLSAITPDGFSGATLADPKAFEEALARQGSSGGAPAPALQFALYNPGAQPGADLLKPMADAKMPSAQEQPVPAQRAHYVRQKILDLATDAVIRSDERWLDNVDSNFFNARQSKCAEFVYDILTEAGASPGTPNFSFLQFRFFPPTAGDWADPKFEIPGWRVLGPGEVPEPGDVAAQPADRYARGYTGHVMIVGEEGTLLGTGPDGKLEGIPQVKLPGWLNDHMPNLVSGNPGGPVVYRRYMGN